MPYDNVQRQMKYFFTLLLLQSSVLLFAQSGNITGSTVSPLTAYSSDWNDIKYSKCNTAVNAAYMTSAEKDVIYILNLIRSYPALFAKTVLKKYPSASGQGYLADDVERLRGPIEKLERAILGGNGGVVELRARRA